MKLHVQLALLLGVSLLGTALPSPAFSQSGVKAQLAQERRAERQAEQQQKQQQRQNAQNAARAGAGRANQPGARNPNSLPPKALERLQDLPPKRQEQFLRNNQRFQSLPPQEQAQIRDRLQEWNKLGPAQQQELRDRQQVWERMTPQQQRNVVQTLLPRWQKLPPVRRQAILQRLHSLRDLSEPERQGKLNDPNFVQGLNSEDRDTLTQLAHLHVGMAADSPGL